MTAVGGPLARHVARVIADAVAVDDALTHIIDVVRCDDHRRIAVIQDLGGGNYRVGRLHRTGFLDAELRWRTYISLPAGTTLIGGIA